jgi:predicted Zn-dependent protease
MIFRDAVSQGVVRGNTFQHKQMGFTLSFPSGWRIRNKPDEVVAVSPDGEAMVVLGPLGNQRGAPADLAKERFRPESPAEILSMTQNGLPVAVVTSVGQDKRPFKAAVIYHEDKAYLVAGRGDSPAAFARYGDAISSTIESFRALTDAEKKSAKTLEIRTIKAAKGLSYAGLAKESPLGINAESYLRLLNGQYPEGEPVSGQIIKIVK